MTNLWVILIIMLASFVAGIFIAHWIVKTFIKRWWYK